MNITRPWAFWRQAQYGAGFGFVFVLCALFVYNNYFYVAPSCFDGKQNGDERGADCGGGCTKICAFDVTKPNVKWSRSFRVTEGQYNAVAYIENTNEVAATPEIPYVFSLYDADGLIVERRGRTFLPPDSVYPVFEGRIPTGGRVPTQTFIELGEPELWIPGNSGRNQFTVVQRELTAADPRPRLDAVLQNNALTATEEVEVIATIFDANGNALTSSRTFVDEFLPRSQTDVVFTWPEPIAKTLRSCEVPTDVLVAIDLSGSMNNDQDEPPEPISSVIASAQSFVLRLGSLDQVGVATFATEAALESQLSRDTGGAVSTIAGLTIDPEEETGSTNTGDALRVAREELESVRHNPNARKVAVLLTDGLATAPDEDPEGVALIEADHLKSEDIELYVIGLGEKVNMEFLQALSSGQGYAYQAITRAEVDSIYRTITGAICEDGAAIIDIVPKSNAGFQSL